MIVRRSFLTVAALSACLTLGAAPRRPASVDVAMTTTMGTIVVRLDAAHAPVTVANFLHYVDTRQFDGASFYRSVRTGSARPAGKPKIQIIQGGLQMKLGDAGLAKLPSIPLEATTKTGLHNTPGTIAMARENAPNTASTEFFINTADDTWLDAQKFADHAGYAVFGRVLRGMDVVRKIQQANAKDDPMMGEMLAPPVTITTMRRLRSASP